MNGTSVLILQNEVLKGLLFTEFRFLIMLIYDVNNPHSKTEIMIIIYPDKLS